MINPHPPRLRMNRRNTVSVTPAIGASTVAGEIVTLPIFNDGGTTAGVGRTLPPASSAKALPGRASPARVPAELSQNFFTIQFYLWSPSTLCYSSELLLLDLAQLRIQIRQGLFQHPAMPRIRRHLKLLLHPFPRKL